MNFLVTEVQVAQDGTVGAITNSYDNQNDASAKYYQILSAAAVSALKIHSAIMYGDTGQFIRNDYFIHEPAEPAEGEPAEE